MKFSPEMRVNAIVPGFLLTNQNRALLTNEDGSYTDRARTIIAHPPAGRFAEPEELLLDYIRRTVEEAGKEEA